MKVPGPHGNWKGPQHHHELPLPVTTHADQKIRVNDDEDDDGDRHHTLIIMMIYNMMVKTAEIITSGNTWVIWRKM